MQGRVTDAARAKEVMARMPSDVMAAFRPDVLGSVVIGYDDGAWTQVLYFTSEAEAREGERKEPPGELQDGHGGDGEAERRRDDVPRPPEPLLQSAG